MELKNKKIILASASPRRREILKNAGYDFDIVISDYDEDIIAQKFSDELVENCAYQKALDVYNKIADKNNKLIISADTVVVLDDIILGKPIDKNDAFKMLKNLSSKTHFVATSICLLSADKIIKATKKTKVSFRELSDDEIIDYIDSKKPYDKAGAYGIQDENFDFVLSVEGELNNVIGFPLELFKEKIALIN